MYLQRCLLCIWLLPSSLAGLLLYLLAHGCGQVRQRWFGNAILVHGQGVDTLLRYWPLGASVGLASGQWIFLRRDRPRYRTLVHEITHLQQALRWGILFPFIYLSHSLYARLRGKSSYTGNHFEQAALQAEQRKTRQK